MRSVLLATLVTAVIWPTPSLANPPDHIVIAFIDGPRYAETFGAPDHIPNLWNDIGPDGAILTEFRNTGTTATLPGHASSLSGTWQHIANNGTEHPHAPTLFERLRFETGLPPESCWVVGGKSKLSVLSSSDDPTMGPPYGARHTVGSANDSATMETALDILDDWAPRLLLVSLSDTDLYAHAENWEGYLTAIATADSLIGELWRFLSDDPTFAGRSTLFVTADHGRHDNRPDLPHDGFISHGDHCDGCEHIPFVAVGAGIAPGLQLDLHHDQRDVAATVAAMLGIGNAGMDGRVIEEMLDPGAIPQPPIAGAGLTVAHAQPFVARGQITVSSPRPADIHLDIYDLAGRLVRQLQHGRAGAEPAALSWDGRHTDGTSASPGIYFLRVTAAGHVATGRLVLLP